jgi:CRISPR-associated endonuclease/helicase Cas3
MFWAKTRPTETAGNTTGWRYKPVGHHLLDVGAVALRYLFLNPARLKRESVLTGLLPDAHALLCAALAALHDLGKISPWFQAQVADLWPEAALGPMPSSAQSIRHWQATAVLLGDPDLRNMLAARLPEEALGDQMIAAIAGHHGRAPGLEYLGDNAIAHREALGVASRAIAATLTAEILSVVVPTAVPAASELQAETFSFSLNGLITLADWVGSDTTAFPFEDPAVPLAAYWPKALERADAALAAKGLTPASPKLSVSLSDLSPRAGATPRPMQRAAAALDIGEGPTLVILEDGTGSGKTEAAMLLAGRMMARGLGEGLYVALPTMATANAMHGRLDRAMGGLFDDVGARSATLVLAHGKAALAQTLERLAARDTRSQSDEQTVSSRFNDWIADSRKKAFFADAGAGTIDQAFLAVLPKKHLTLRQYALAGRILIVDEAHACDAYMGEELKVLVEMQARLGGSIIILSATLEEATRRDLLIAFARGRGLKGRAAAVLAKRSLAKSYPLLTWCVGGGDFEEIPVEALPGLARSIAINRLPDRAASIALALGAARSGACVAILCNAVDSAVAVSMALLDAGHPQDRLTLFHARFAMGDRMNIEEQVLALFGPGSRSEMRAGQILVATQVIEQSLDLDFDVMITDLAPVDLVIQRAGRLWRHARATRPVDGPTLHIVSPDPAAALDKGWLKETLGPASYTYPLPGVLWRTARDLFAEGCLESPGSLRSLVETAYRPEGEDLPPGLVRDHENALGKGMAERFQARRNTIDPRNGYAGMRDVSSDEDIGTRLGEDSITLRLARRTADGLAPRVERPGAPDQVNWALSEVSVRRAWLAGKDADTAVPAPSLRDRALIDAVRAGWPEWEQAMPLYSLDDAGRLMMAEDHGFAYDRRTGLTRIRPAGDV